MAKKYVQNNSAYHLTFGKFVFECRTTDKGTGRVLTTGVTMIEESELEKFHEIKMFQKALQNGDLVEYDEAPKEALLDSQLLDMASEKVAALEQEVARLKKDLAKGSKKADQDRIAELEAIIAEPMTQKRAVEIIAPFLSEEGQKYLMENDSAWKAEGL